MGKGRAVIALMSVPLLPLPARCLIAARTQGHKSLLSLQASATWKRGKVINPLGNSQPVGGIEVGR